MLSSTVFQSNKQSYEAPQTLGENKSIESDEGNQFRELLQEKESFFDINQPMQASLDRIDVNSRSSQETKTALPEISDNVRMLKDV